MTLIRELKKAGFCILAHKVVQVISMNAEIELFLKESPGSKPKTIKIDSRLKDRVANWARIHVDIAQENKKIKSIERVGVASTPPVILHLYKKSDGYRVIDGWHRLYIAIQEGLNYIEAYIKDFTK